MNREEILKLIISKREFSNLPQEDIWLAYKKFEGRQCPDEEKIRLTRDLLRKVYSAFASGKLLNIKDKNEDWFLRKHLSTRERLPHYNEVYKRILNNFGVKLNIIDLGAGINGFSYKFFPKNTHYVAVEAVGQLANLMNFYFEKNRLNAKAIHESLFNLSRIKEIIQDCKKPRIIFLFKVLDSLEMLEGDYSKKLLTEIIPLADKVVISFATRSMIKKEKFKVNRKWIIDFIKENFKVLDEFEIGGEKYVVFKKK